MTNTELLFALLAIAGVAISVAALTVTIIRK